MCDRLYRYGSLMIAIVFMMRTKYYCNLYQRGGITKRTHYECNNDKKGVQIWLQSLSKRTTYDCIDRIFIFASFVNQSHVTLGRFLTLQSYLVFFEQDCIHIRSSFWPSLQSYLVPMIKIIASIYGSSRWRFICSVLLVWILETFKSAEFFRQ